MDTNIITVKEFNNTIKNCLYLIKIKELLNHELITQDEFLKIKNALNLQ